MKRASVGAFLAVGLAAAFGCSQSAGPSGPTVPPVDPATGLRVATLGPVPPLPTWSDNPGSDAKTALGRSLFFDSRFSGSGNMSCGGGCHLSIGNFQSSTPLDTPDRSYPKLAPTLPRHTPSLLNLVYEPMMRWDGSYFTNLYDMCVFPLAEANMNLAHALPPDQVDAVDVPEAQAALQAKLASIPGYVTAFQSVFGVDVTTLSPTDAWSYTGKAIATYLRVAVSRDSVFDLWNAGKVSSMSASAINGLAIFEGKGNCAACHSGPQFSDFQFHNVSTSLPDASGNRPDEGRKVVTGLASDGGRFLTPTLRSSGFTSPYLHDGSLTTLSEVIRAMTGKASVADPNHDVALSGSVELSDSEVNDLVEFIKSLNGAALSVADVSIPTSFP